MAYVDGFLLPIPKRKVNAYLEMSRKAGKAGRSMARSSIASASVTI